LATHDLTVAEPDPCLFDGFTVRLFKSRTTVGATIFRPRLAAT